MRYDGSGVAVAVAVVVAVAGKMEVLWYGHLR